MALAMASVIEAEVCYCMALQTAASKRCGAGGCSHTEHGTHNKAGSHAPRENQHAYIPKSAYAWE